MPRRSALRDYVQHRGSLGSATSSFALVRTGKIFAVWALHGLPAAAWTIRLIQQMAEDDGDLEQAEPQQRRDDKHDRYDDRQTLPQSRLRRGQHTAPQFGCDLVGR